MYEPKVPIDGYTYRMSHYIRTIKVFDCEYFLRTSFISRVVLCNNYVRFYWFAENFMEYNRFQLKLGYLILKVEFVSPTSECSIRFLVYLENMLNIACDSVFEVDELRIVSFPMQYLARFPDFKIAKGSNNVSFYECKCRFISIIPVFRWL